jgi:Phage tail tube protein
MARAYGSSAHLLMKRETAYGQSATGNYIRMPFNRCSLDSEQGLIDDPVLGQGRDPLAPLQDVITDEGDIVVPVDPRYLGLWLTGLFCDPTPPTTSMAAGTMRSPRAATTCRAYTRSRHAEGVGVLLACRRQAQLDCAGVHPLGPGGHHHQRHRTGETRFGTSQGGTPTSLTFSRISQFQGSIKRAGSPVGTSPAAQ